MRIRPNGVVTHLIFIISCHLFKSPLLFIFYMLL
nr:MAG TPA: hypothetical protein [Bacteriophage sp.]